MSRAGRGSLRIVKYIRTRRQAGHAGACVRRAGAFLPYRNKLCVARRCFSATCRHSAKPSESEYPAVSPRRWPLVRRCPRQSPRPLCAAPTLQGLAVRSYPPYLPLPPIQSLSPLSLSSSAQEPARQFTRLDADRTSCIAPRTPPPPHRSPPRRQSHRRLWRTPAADHVQAGFGSVGYSITACRRSPAAGAPQRF